MRDQVMALLRYGRTGEPGVEVALVTLYRAFVDAVANDRDGGEPEALAEFERMCTNAETLLAAEPPHTKFEWPGGRPTFGSPTAEQSAGDDESSLLGRLSHDGEWLDDQHFDPLEYAVDGIISEGIGLLTGPPKKGKSWLGGNIGLGVAKGDFVLGCIPVQRRPVLYLALEDGHRRLQERFRRMLGFAQPIPKGIEVITEATPVEALAVIAEFMTVHAAEKPLVILDTLGKVKRHKKPGEDSYLVDYEVGTTLKNLVKLAPGSTLLVVHHTRKAEAADFVDMVSGTQGIAGSVDFVLVLTRKRHENNATLSVTGRDIREAEYALHADDGVLWRLDGADLVAAQEAVDERRAAINLGDRQMDVYLAVAAADGPITAGDVASQFEGMDNNVAGQHLRRLNAGGYIHKISRGVFSLREPSEDADQQPSEDTEQQGDGTAEQDVPEHSVNEVNELNETEQNSSSETDSVSFTPDVEVNEVNETEPSPSAPSCTADDGDSFTSFSPDVEVNETESVSDLQEHDPSFNSFTSFTTLDQPELPPVLDSQETPPPAETALPLLEDEPVLQDESLPVLEEATYERIKAAITRRLAKVPIARRYRLREAVNSKYRVAFNTVFDLLVAQGYVVADDNIQGVYRLASPDCTAHPTDSPEHLAGEIEKDE